MDLGKQLALVGVAFGLCYCGFYLYRDLVRIVCMVTHALQRRRPR